MTGRTGATRVRRPGARARRLVLALLAGVVALLVPATALAHPLGNFTINHYAGLRVSPTDIRLDVVLDRAEIPTFQERLRLDRDEDGEVSDTEAAEAREPECRALAESLSLTVDGVGAPLRLVTAGLSFPSGAGGLSTMRLVCGFVAPVSALPASVAFADRSFPDRLGWREVVVEGDGVTIAGAGLLESSVSQRLTAYPEDRLAAPLAIYEVAFDAAMGGPTLPPWSQPDAVAVAGGGSGASAGGGGGGGGGGSGPAAGPAVPGGIGGEIPSIFQATDLTPGVLIAALLAAAALGAGHALTPGHGKTLMAAYLVGTRGTALHAAGLGLSVTVSHTLGIVVLAGLVVGAGAALPAEVVVRWLPAVAALAIVAIGGWMLITELRRRRAAGRAGGGHGHSHPHAAQAAHVGEHTHAARAGEHAHEHPHEPTHEHPHADEHPHEDPHGPAHEHPRRPTHEHPHATEHGHEHPHSDDAAFEHSHGGVRHSHLPPAGSTITWRSLFALGLAGGIVPSTSALLILLGTIAAGRPAFGFVLVVAFGLGMAVVLGGIGLALVLARDRLSRLATGSRLGALSAWAPLAAACVVLGLGLWLTGQAILGQPTL